MHRATTRQSWSTTVAKRSRVQADTPQRALSIAETLAELAKIDRSLAAFERTAPRAVAALGGRDALQAVSQMTCIGPIPRMDAGQWQTLAAEHADFQHEAMRARHH